MHILIANNIYPPIQAGGAELIVAYLAEGLVERGHRVTVVSTCAPEMEPYPVERRNGVEIIRFFPPNLYWSFTRDRQPGMRKAVWHARDAWNVEAGRRFATILAERQPDIVHTHLIDGMSASLWHQARQMGLPIVHTAHDYHLLCPRAFLLTRSWKLCSEPRLACRAYRAWHLRTTRNIDLFASPSQFLLERHREAGLAAARQQIVHNGIPQPPDVADVRAARDPGSRGRFLLLARLTVEKGIETVLDAMARLPADLPIELTIAGSGPLENRVRVAASRDGRIRYVGYVQQEEKLAALARAGYLLLPSLWYENAPVVIVEAAAYGLGLIASDIGGIPEFVEPGRTGLLFPPGDSAALADLMIRVATGADTLHGLDLATSALAQRFTESRMVASYEAQYASLLATRQDRRLYA